MEEGRKIIHLTKDGKDYYFGSVAAIFSVFGADEIGITYGSLRNYGLSTVKPYLNEKRGITIREGVLLAKQGNRGKKAKAE